MSTATTPPPAIEYPDSDGLPMSDNTLQFQWIVALQGNLDVLFRDRSDVFVAGDHLIYPIQGDNVTRQAPDVYVAFGRPKGHRGSYRVWEEGGIFPQVVFEVLSPGNRAGEMNRKREFYRKYGAEEYYVIDPDNHTAKGWLRGGDAFHEVPDMNGHTSARLNVRFEIADGRLTVFYPDGRPFPTFRELGAQAEAERHRAETAERQSEAERQKTDAERQRADAERQKAEAERQKAEAERQKAEAERQKAEKLAAKLRELGVDPDAV